MRHKKNQEHRANERKLSDRNVSESNPGVIEHTFDSVNRTPKGGVSNPISTAITVRQSSSNRLHWL